MEVSGTTGLCTESEGLTVCDTTSSDERVAGTNRYNPECELSKVGDTTTGDCSFPITLTNDGGTWEGTCEGTTTWSTSEPAHVHKFDCTYLGTSDYEGLRYVVHVEGSGDYPWPTTGRIEFGQLAD